MKKFKLFSGICLVLLGFCTSETMADNHSLEKDWKNRSMLLHHLS